MPSWWNRRAKSRSNSIPAAGTREEQTPSPLPLPGSEKRDLKQIKKGKARSFDVAATGGRWAFPSDRTIFRFHSDASRPRHPLPPPLASPSSPSPPQVRRVMPTTTPSGSNSVSVSSVSSSGTDEASDKGFYRYAESANTPRSRHSTPDSRGQLHVAEDKYLFSGNPVWGHEKPSDAGISPRKELLFHDAHPFSNGIGSSHFRATVEAMYNAQPRNHGSGSKGYNASTCPIHSRTFPISPGSPNRKYDNLKSPHPLPLPPGSPTSPTSGCFQSKWKKGKLIGQGTFGHVFLGFNRENGQMCAIKEVRVVSDDSDSRESLKQLSQEISLLSQLTHPNIVQYYGSELVEDTLSVYLEYVSGGSVHKLLQEYGPFSEPVIRSYAAQILAGLAYLHGRNTVHRDIKGANILVDPNGEVKLADFGMAKHISKYTSIHSFKGSPYWMAPEVIMSTGGYSLSVDIWSFGCTIIEMATSKPPWSHYEGVAAIFKIINSKDIPEIPSHLSTVGKDFLRLCLQRDPSARPTAAQLMEHPFIRFQATSKSTKSLMVREPFPLSSDGTDTLSTEFSHYRNMSPLHDSDHAMQHKTGVLPAMKSAGDLIITRTNMSLPVSPCSSPLRNFRQPNRSCVPSPPHPLLSGALNGGLGNYSLNSVGSHKSYLEPWLDIHQVRYQTTYDLTRT